MKKLITLTLLFFGGLTAFGITKTSPQPKGAPIIKNNLRAPAYPLVTIDPYTSAWSTTNNLYDSQVKHWTGKDFPFVGAIRVDGNMYRFMGVETPHLTAIAPTAHDAQWIGKYTFTNLGIDCHKRDFDDSKWNTGRAVFGSFEDYPFIGTLFAGNDNDIWIRRTINLDHDLVGQNIVVKCSHDDIDTMFVNGINVLSVGNSWVQDSVVLLPESVIATLTTGKNVISVHTHNVMGGAESDFGLYSNDGNGNLTPLFPMVDDATWSGQYTTTDPGSGFEQPAFDDSNWKTGKASFGSPGTPDYSDIGTHWGGSNANIWIRRTINLNSDLTGKRVYIKCSHDDVFQLYVNGNQVLSTGVSWVQDSLIALPPNVVSTLKVGKNVIASHTYNDGGGALTDYGLYVADDTPTMNITAVQKSVDVQATHTQYVFDCGNVELKLTFLAPFMLDSLDLVSRPVNYISYDISSLDAKPHSTQIYFEAAPNWALDTPDESSFADGYTKNNMAYVRTGSAAQNILGKAGDDVRIDWGHFYMAANNSDVTTNVGDQYTMQTEFAQNGKLSGDLTQKSDAHIAISQDLGSNTSASGKIMVGYDDIYSVQYFGTNVRPYWNRNNDKTIEDEFSAANTDYSALVESCSQFDNDLMTKATDLGGSHYAELCALAYRQTIAAHKLLQDPNNGDILYFSKENFSGGFIGTVDVTYPAAPLFLLYNPIFVEGLLNPIYYYSESGKWAHGFPAHDIGTYPLANGQIYGGDGMPLEEAGNLLVLTAAIAATEGNANYAAKHWDSLTTWADYLVANGADPTNQLCSDDFAGPSPHNINLSIKAILGLHLMPIWPICWTKRQLLQIIIIKPKRWPQVA